MKKGYKISTFTGLSIVVANMIGAGAFTSLGFQLELLNHTFSIVALWVLGGVVALCGAFSYAEIGTLIKKSGGEFTFLSEIYHPLIGYLSGWISITVGFAAPIALSAFAFTEYFPLPVSLPKMVSIALIFVITLIHSFNLNNSSKFQNITTLFKLFLIVTLIVAGLLLPQSSQSAFTFHQNFLTEITSAGFAVCLIYVSYSYSGWNAAAYITEEFHNPKRSIPRALILGTLTVMVLYTLLQIVFLKHASLQELTGRLDIGAIVVANMLGGKVSFLFGLGLSLLLISGISAMVWVGPRVTSSIAEKYRLWHFFRQHRNDIPQRALWLQFVISTVLLLTGTFQQIMVYCGVLLTISTLLVVAGLFVVRYRQKKKGAFGERDHFRSPLFPLLQIIFIVVSIWMIVYAFVNNTRESLFGLINLFIGLLTYLIDRRFFVRKRAHSSGEFTTIHS